MAQYFNVVSNASGTFILEEVPRICTADGQRIQLVGDVNNNSNGSQRLVTYTAAPQNRQAIFSSQTINLGNQMSATRLEQGQNRFIIKTNDIIGTQEILKPNTLNAHIVNKNTVGIASNTGIKTVSPQGDFQKDPKIRGTSGIATYSRGSVIRWGRKKKKKKKKKKKTECKNEGQQMQFMKIQNANATIVSKQNTLLQEKNQTAILTRSNVQNNITSPPPLFINCPSFTPNQTEEKLPKSNQNKTRQLPDNIVGVVSQTPDGIKVVTTMENQIQNSNATGPKSTLPVCKTINLQRQNVTVKPVCIPNSNISHVRPAAIVPPEISKIPARVQPPEMEHLNEQIKQAKFKQLQKQHIEKQRFQQNNTQRLSNTLQQVQQSPLNAPTRSFINSVQQRMQPISPQQMQKSVAMSVPASAEHNTRVANVDVEVNPSDCVQEKGQQPWWKEINFFPSLQQPSSPRLEHENSSSESIAYLQKTINDPANAIVQHQIQGNLAKMLVMLATGEQRLITFDIPNEDCTVRDLLDQMRAVLGKVNITISGDTQVSLVDDPALGINYIVDAGSSELFTASFESADGDCNSTPEHLNEQFKRAKFKRLQKQHVKKQRFQNNTQRLSNTLQQVQKSPLNAPTHSFINSVQQRMQQISPQQMQKSVTMSVPASTEHNTRVANGDVKVNPLDCVQEKEQQSFSPRLEHENSSSESMAYLQKTINDPANAIVQHQIEWNTAKILLTLATGEERLITFDMPNEDCTVRDLLDQIRAVVSKMNITFSDDTQFSFMNDALGINYIVDEGGSGLLSTSFESDNGDCNSTYEIVNSTPNTENLLQNTNALDENSNNSL